jgi:hypothetical protein
VHFISWVCGSQYFLRVETWTSGELESEQGKRKASKQSRKDFQIQVDWQGFVVTKADDNPGGIQPQLDE